MKIETEKSFHAVEFMRETRDQLSVKYLTDKEKYLAELKAAVDYFKNNRKLLKVIN